MKLFQNVGGNQFKMVSLVCENDEKPFWGWSAPEPGTQLVDINTLPVTIDDLFAKDVEYLGADDPDPEGQALIKAWKDSAKILAARRVPGFGPNMRRSSNPEDFIYEVDVTYIPIPEESHRRMHMLFGVSADGKHKQVFAS